MRNPILAPFVAAILIQSWGFASADTTTTRQEIGRQYKLRNKAAVAGDRKGFMRFYAADFTVKRIDGGIGTRQQFERENRLVRYRRFATRIEKLTFSGNKAIATTTNKGAISFRDTKGEIGPKGKEYTVPTAGRARDTWVKTAQGWKIQRNEDLTPLR